MLAGCGTGIVRGGSCNEADTAVTGACQEETPETIACGMLVATCP